MHALNQEILTIGDHQALLQLLRNLKNDSSTGSIWGVLIRPRNNRNAARLAAFLEDSGYLVSYINCRTKSDAKKKARLAFNRGGINILIATHNNLILLKPNQVEVYFG